METNILLFFKFIFFLKFYYLIKIFFIKKFYYKNNFYSIIFCWLNNNTKNLKVYYYNNFINFFFKNSKFLTLKYFILKNYVKSSKKFKINLQLFIKLIFKKLFNKFVFFFLKLLSWLLFYFLTKIWKFNFIYLFFKVYNNWTNTKNKIFRYIKRRTMKKIISLNKFN